MPFQVSPGVNVSEIDLTTVIPAVSTTEGAIAMHAKWGPVDQRVLIGSEDQLATTYGTPNSNTASDFFTAASFLSYGNKLYVNRVVRSSNAASMATDTSIARNAQTNTANTKNTIIKNESDYYDNYSSGITGVGHWVAKYPGATGNTLRVSVCRSSNAFSSTANGTLSFTNNSVTVTASNSAYAATLVAGDILIAGPDRYEVKVASVAGLTITLANKYIGNTVATQSLVQRRWEFASYFDRAPGTSSAAAREGSSNDEMHIVVADEDGRISGTSNTALERFSSVSKAADAKNEDGSTNYYVNVINQQSKYIWWTANLTGITHIGKNLTTSLDYRAGNQKIPLNDSLSRGRDGGLPRNADYMNGLNAFANPETVDVSLVLTGDGNQTVAIHAINNIAEVRKDCLAVISPRRADVVNNAGYIGAEMDDIVAFRNLLPSSSYAVMDGNYKYMYDKYNDIYRYVALNGDTAGLMVRTDNERDPWYSPAGFNRGQVKNVIKLAFNATKGQRDQLYKAGVNPVVTFPGQGTVLFGDKTLLAKPSAFDRINVRRLFIVLEKAISTAAKFTLFEFNDDFTRAQFRNIVEPFLRDVQGRRGIYDFRVVCDSSNNTGEVIDRNEFVGDIYIKPARSINFIQLNFVAVRTGVEFSEVVGQF
jgi:phage tail sheath protein FI